MIRNILKLVTVFVCAVGITVPTGRNFFLFSFCGPTAKGTLISNQSIITNHPSNITNNDFYSDSPADYDELAEEETEDSGGDHMRSGFGVTDEDDDAILNEEDMDTCPPGLGSFRIPHSAAATPPPLAKETPNFSKATNRFRSDSTGSGSSMTTPGSSKLSSLYFSTQMARNSADSAESTR
jgi:hypothetical protein